jgi:hypothetical protein
MAQERLPMRDVYRILQLHLEQKKTGRAIAKIVGRGRTTMAVYLDRAKKAGFTEWTQDVRCSDRAFRFCPARRLTLQRLRED